MSRDGKVMMPKTHIILKRKQFDQVTILVLFGSQEESNTIGASNK